MYHSEAIMALVIGYRCATCNVLIDQNELGLHLQIYSDHTINQTIIDDSVSVESSPGLTSYKDGVLYFYDPVRKVRVSSSRISLFWGLSVNGIKNSWLKMFSAGAPAGGFIVPLNSMVVKVTAARLSGSGSWSIQLTKSFSLDDTVYTMDLVETENSKIDVNLGVPVEAGSMIHCYHGSGSSSNNVQVWVSLAWID
jgi:hypothetical protein